MAKRTQAAQTAADNAQIVFTNRTADNAQAKRNYSNWKTQKTFITLVTTLTNFNAGKRVLRSIAIRHLCDCVTLKEPTPGVAGQKKKRSYFNPKYATAHTGCHARELIASSI